MQFILVQPRDDCLFLKMIAIFGTAIRDTKVLHRVCSGGRVRPRGQITKPIECGEKLRQQHFEECLHTTQDESRAALISPLGAQHRSN